MLIAGGRLVDPTLGIDAIRDLRTSGVVLEIGEHLEPAANEIVFDARGAVVAPGFIDMHVHLRDPGETQKETLESGGAAALRGGFTAVACMPNTKPALDDPPALGGLMDRIARLGKALPRIYPIAAITRDRAGGRLCDYRALVKAGAAAFSDDGATVADATLLEAAALAARDTGAAFVSHCEPEAAIAARDIQIAARTGMPWHLAHLSTTEAVEVLRAARAAGSRVTAEVTPHHLLCTRESTVAMGAAAAVNPPLGGDRDVRALRDAVREGLIDVFASDHAPHEHDEKYGERPPPGFSGLEIAVGAYAAAVPGLPLSRFVALLSSAPARILRVAGGTLRPGSAADVTILREETWRVDARDFLSKGKVTPFDGMLFSRRPIATIVAGEIRYEAQAAPAA